MSDDPYQEFLVAFDYGMGGLWAIMIAPTAEAIRAEYPELVIVDDRSDWMTPDHYEDLREKPLWLDQPPTGILIAVIADRGKSP